MLWILFLGIILLIPLSKIFRELYQAIKANDQDWTKVMIFKSAIALLIAAGMIIVTINYIV